LVSLFQTLNILFLVILIIGLNKGRSWSIGKSEIIILSIIILAVNYIRIYKVLGIKNILEKYEKNLGVFVHPIIYFILSIGALLILIIGFFLILYS
jgi:hypothetical protein